MYKFVIKGIDGSIKHTSIIELDKVSDALSSGKNALKYAIVHYPHKYHNSDSVDVIPVFNPNYLLVQQY